MGATIKPKHESGAVADRSRLGHRHADAGRLVLPQHELLNAVGKVQQSTGASAAHQLKAHPRIDPQGQEWLAQARAFGQLLDPHLGSPQGPGSGALGDRALNLNLCAHGPCTRPAAGGLTPGFWGDDRADRGTHLIAPRSPRRAVGGRGDRAPVPRRTEMKPTLSPAPPGGFRVGCRSAGGCPGGERKPQRRDIAPGWTTSTILSSVKGSPSATASMTSASTTANATASAPSAARVLGSGPQLTLLYDGGCPLCLREVGLLRRRDGLRGRLAFVDIDVPDYDPGRFGGISYRQAMGRIHAIAADGTVLRDLEVFRRAYQLVDLGWIYAPTSWPLLGPLVDAAYGFWASQRLRWTGRPDLDQLCRDRQSCGVPQPPHPTPQTPRP